MNISFWHKAPMVKLLLPFACGIGTTIFFTVPVILSAIVSAIAACGIIVSTIRTFPYRFQWINGVCISICFFSSGTLLHNVQNELFAANHFSKATDAEQFIIKIDDAGTIKTSSFKYKGVVLAYTDSLQNRKKASGNVLMYIRKETNQLPFQYGDVVVVKRDYFKEISPPKNPEEFNYKRYLAFNNIHYSAYLDNSQLYVTSLNKGNPVFKWVYAVQEYFKQTLVTYIQSANETGVAQALLYGYDDDIDAETVDAYAKTGTLHVLAVSGMHVGIIFMILGWLLAVMDKNKKTQFAKYIIILCSLWVYSFLCGLSPSILRATVMFSFIIIGMMINRNGNIYNTLAASAFFLLCWDNNMLANVGFQLSYMAVLGIVFLQPYIYNWWSPRTWLSDQIWKITSVSLAAQISTSPIGILYFHQFPNCFLISNLVIIPLTTLILYAGIILLIVSKITVVATVIGKCMYYAIAFTNTIVQWVEKIPYAYVEGIYINILQSILLYLFFSALTAYFLLQRKFFLRYALYASIFFFIQQAWINIKNTTQQEIIVYSINRSNAIRLTNSNESILIVDSVLYADKNKMRFHIQQHTWKSGINKQTILYTDSNWKNISFHGQHILISGKHTPNIHSPFNLLIIKNSIDTNTLNQLSYRQAVITSALSRKETQSLKSYFIGKQISYYAVADSGAFQLSLHKEL